MVFPANAFRQEEAVIAAVLAEPVRGLPGLPFWVPDLRSREFVCATGVLTFAIRRACFRSGGRLLPIFDGLNFIKQRSL